MPKTDYNLRSLAIDAFILSLKEAEVVKFQTHRKPNLSILMFCLAAQIVSICELLVIFGNAILVFNLGDVDVINLIVYDALITLVFHVP